jgi:hypothetical protein
MLHVFPRPWRSRLACLAVLTVGSLLLTSLAACGRSLPPNVAPPGGTASHSEPALPPGTAADKEAAK